MPTLDRRLIRPGAEIAYHDTGGDGPAVVLTHGAGMDSTTWDAQVSALRDAGYRVILWDLRGHGESVLSGDGRFEASAALDDLAALLDACEASRPVLVGHSLGGNLGQRFVRDDPTRAGGLIVIGSTWNAGPLTRGERVALRLAIPALRLTPARTLPGLMARASAVTPTAIARTEEVFSRMPKRLFVDVMAATSSLVEPDATFRTPVPLGLIRGAQDATGNIATAMPRWAEAEGIEEHVVPDAGHVVSWDAPDATSRALLEILGEMRR